MNQTAHAAGFLLARQLIDAGILVELSPERIRHVAPKGAVLITCGDRDRVTGHLSGCQKIVPIHVIALNGGSLLLGKGIDETRQRTIMEDCRDALTMKDIHFVFNLSHFPCGKGDALSMGLQANILANLQGKNVLKEFLGKDVGVLTIISIDWREAGIPGVGGVHLYGTGRNKIHAITHFDPSKPHQHHQPILPPDTAQPPSVL